MKKELLKKLKFNILVCSFILLILSSSKIVQASDLTSIQEVDSKKDFVVTFTQSVKQNSASSDTVFVKDSSGNKVAKVNLSLLEDDKSIKVLHPEEGYKKGEIYTLVITQNLLSKKDNKKLKSLVEKSFKIVEDENRDYQLNKKVDEIISSIIKPEMPDYQKELLIHDYIVKNTKYDKSLSNDSYLPYGVLVKGIGSCVGYSKTMKLLLNKVGIECEIVIGRDSGDRGHAWNIVKLYDEYYQVDATFDDSLPDKGNSVEHKYFNITDKKMSQNHNWDSSKYPLCNGDIYDYGICDYCIKNNIAPDKLMEIKGTVFLPENVVASEKNIEVTLKISPNGYTNYSKDKTVIIPVGKNSAEYSILLPHDAYRLSYEIENYKGTSYIERGYYSPDGFTFIEKELYVIEEMDNDIPVNIIKADTVSGTIYLPEGKKAYEDLSISVSLHNDYYSFYRDAYIKIPKESNYANYIITVPKDEYLYDVECYKSTYVEGVLNDAIYTNGHEKACNVSAGSSNVNITLQTGKVIKGVIFLPCNKSSGNGCMNILGREYNANEFGRRSYKTYVNIKNGVSSVPYSLTVPKEYKKVFIYYEFDNTRYLGKYSNYYLAGYFNEDLSHDESMPPLINLDSNESIIDLRVNDGVEIKGLVSLPNDQSAPKEGVQIEVCANNGKDKYHFTVNIPEGKSSAEYRLLVKKNKKYKISYGFGRMDEGTGYPILYYNKATPIEICDKNIENINLELPKDYNVWK